MSESAAIERLQSVCRIINRALSGQSTEVAIGHFGTDAPVTTDGRDIHVSAAFPNSEGLSLRERCAVWKGLNYHALGHIMFTDNTFSLRGAEREAFDVLEDARIEWLMSAVFPGTRKYFVNNLVKMGLNDPVLLWGRRHLLPVRLRRPSVPGRALDIWDEFIRSRALAEREALAREFASLVALGATARQLSGDITGLGRYRDPVAGTDSALGARAREAIAGFGQGDAEYGSPDMVREAGLAEESTLGDDSRVYDDLEGAIGAERLERDLEEAVGAAAEGRQYGRYSACGLAEGEVRPDPVLLRQLYHVFSRARSSTGSCYQRGLPGGRVDARGAMRYSWSGDPRIFKRFEEDRLDEARLSIALVLDKSGSMSASDPAGISKRAGSALAWAAEKAGHEVMAVAFDGESHVVKAPHERAFRDYACGGATNPVPALEAAEVFCAQARYNPVLLFVSDGEFEEAAHTKLDEIAGGRTAVYVIAPAWGAGGWSGTRVRPRPIRSAREVTRVIRDVVEEEERRRVLAAGRQW